MFFSWLTCILLSVLWFISLQTFTSGKFCSLGCLKWRVLNLLVLPVRPGTGLGVTTRYQNKGIHLLWNKTQMEDYQNKKEILSSWNKTQMEGYKNKKERHVLWKKTPTQKNIRNIRKISEISEKNTQGGTKSLLEGLTLSSLMNIH